MPPREAPLDGYVSKRTRLSSTRSVQGLQQVLHLGGISVRSLAAIAGALIQDDEAEDDLQLEGTMIRLMKGDQREEWSTVKASLKLEMTDGQPVDWVIADPIQLMQVIINNSPALQSQYRKIADEQVARTGIQGQITVNIVVAFDEFTPGNLRKPHNERKTMVLSFACCELGTDLLSNDLMWFSPVCVRSTLIGKVRGGWSRMLRDILKRMFGGGPQSLDAAGVPLTLQGQHFLLFGRLSCLISDNDGLRMGLDVKGHAGKRPCLSCYNIWSKNTTATDGRAITIEETDFSRCEPLEPEALGEFVQALRDAHALFSAGAMTTKAWEEMQRGLGVNWNADGLLFDDDLRGRLRLLQVLRRDFMHGFLQNGVAHDELQLFLAACSERCGLTLGDWRNAFKAPLEYRGVHRSKMRQLWKFFADWVKNFRLHCDASTMMSILSVLGHFAETALEGRAEIAAERDSLIALCAAIQHAQAVKQNPCDAAELQRLRESIKKHFDLAKLAYGSKVVLPKHHYNLHIPAQVEADRLLIDMFVIERHHIAVKRIANNIRDTRTWEDSLCKSVFAWHIRRARSLPVDFRECLLDPVREYEGTSWRIASKAQANGRTVCVGDILLNGREMGYAYEVRALVEENGTVFAVGDCWKLHARKHTSATFKKFDGHVTCRLREACVVHSWYVAAGDLVVLTV